MRFLSLWLFVLSALLLSLFFKLLPPVYEIFARFSVFIVGSCVIFLLSKFLKKLLFNKKLPADGKAVFITGCDSGFGHELAKRLDILGYHVFAACLNPKGEGATQLAEQCSSNVSIIHLNVTSDESVEEAKQYVLKNLDGKILWAVVNNAGVPQAGEIDWTSLEDLKSVCEINTFGTVRVTKAFLPLLKDSKGRVVNNTSAVGRFICPGFVGYCMSKSAAIAFTEGLRIEMLKWDVEVISIEPFFYKTPLTSKQTVIDLATNIWNKADPEIRRDYGENYLESFKRSCYATVHLSSSKVYQVIDCFEDAITAEEPESSYFPAYLPHKLGINLFRCLPASFKENYQQLYIRHCVPSAIRRSHTTS